MKRVLRRFYLLSVAIVLACSARGQGLGLTPDFVQQFLNNNGNPLAGGMLFACSAGASCPGTPQATFSDSSGFSPNTSPVVMDANGRPTSGGIWLSCGINYKLVLEDSTGVVLKTTDNVSCSAFNSSGGGGTQYWQLSGSTISNTNAGGAGNVSIGGGLTVSNNIQTNGGLILRSPAGTPHLATIQAANVMPSDQTWRWPGSDVSGCLSSDGLGNLNFITCGGGGGGGTPGGNSSDIQFNNGGVFGGTDNFQWQNASQRIVLQGISSTPGIVVLTGWIQADGGFDAIINASPSTAQPYNIIQAPTGGMHALSFTADKYVESGSNSGAPSSTPGDTGFPHPGTLYCDTTSSPCTEKLYNGSAWISLATGGATSPGGSDTNVQFNSTGSFAGSANMVWSNSSQRLTITGVSSATPGIHVGNGYVDSDAGFVALPGTATQFNSIRATAGGMAANSFTATTYVQTGHNPGPFSSAPPSPTNADTFAAGALSFDVASNAEQVFNGTAWVPLGGGGSGTPGGPTTSIQYNNAGTLAGSANLEWNNTAQIVAIHGITNTAGLYALTSYIQSDIGFVAAIASAPSTPLTYNAVQAPTGGMHALSFTADKYIESGSNSGVPTATTGETGFPHAGGLYYDTGLSVERVFDGAAWGAVAQQNIDNFFSVTQDFTGSTAINLGGHTTFLTNNTFNVGSSAAEALTMNSASFFSYQPGAPSRACGYTWSIINCSGDLAIATNGTTRQYLDSAGNIFMIDGELIFKSGGLFGTSTIILGAPSGNLQMSSMAGSGFRCAHVSPAGLFSPTATDCGSGGGGVTSVTASAPIASSGGTSPNITCCVGDLNPTATNLTVGTAGSQWLQVWTTTYINQNPNDVNWFNSSGHDYVFFSFGPSETMRLTSGGTVRIASLAGSGNGCVKVDSSGNLSRGATGTC